MRNHNKFNLQYVLHAWISKRKWKSSKDFPHKPKQTFQQPKPFNHFESIYHKDNRVSSELLLSRQTLFSILFNLIQSVQSQRYHQSTKQNTQLIKNWPNFNSMLISLFKSSDRILNILWKTNDKAKQVAKHPFSFIYVERGIITLFTIPAVCKIKKK